MTTSQSRIAGRRSENDSLSDRVPCDLYVVFRILRNYASYKETLTYTQLSDAYNAFDSTPRPKIPPRAWGPHLLELTRVLERSGLPTITGLVVSASTGMPSEFGFWGLPGAPASPNADAFRAYCSTMFAMRWPDDLPGLTRL